MYYIYILRITFKTINSFDNLKKKLKILKIKGNFKNIEIKNFFKNKNNNKIFTLLRSPHIYKKSREHFIYKNFIEKIDIKFNNYINLLNFLIILKKFFIKNFLIDIKIIKKCL